MITDYQKAWLEGEDRARKLQEQVAALRAAAESAWTLIGAEPNVPHRSRLKVMAKLQAALEWGVFSDRPPVDEEQG